MAAVRKQTKLPSDPFMDPTPTSTSTSKQQRSAPPPPPPKQPSTKSPTSPNSAPRVSSSRDRELDSNEVPSVRVVERNKMPRSQTHNSSTQPTAGRHAQAVSRRSHSQDSILLAQAAAVEKAKQAGATGKSARKKNSQHADVIDRMDFTGVGLFHHDGPFDACAPSRNRHRTKAPMLAWSSGGTDEAATSPDITPDTLEYIGRNSDGAYPKADAYKAFSNDYGTPKKKVDAIAEAWGIHEPEPYEEFFAGGGPTKLDGKTPTSSLYGGKEGHNGRSKRSNGGTPRGSGERSREGGEADPSSSRRVANRRSMLPPPQPIFIDDEDITLSTGERSPGVGGVKRSKSLMQRIRKMRDSPNVPVNDDDDEPQSPSTAESAGYSNSYNPSSSAPTRPTHRHQGSFLGKLRGQSREKDGGMSPTLENSESFVFIDESKANQKELPKRPTGRSPSSGPGTRAIGSGGGDYFDASTGEGGVATSPGIGRKPSLMKKMRGVVKSVKA